MPTDQSLSQDVVFDILSSPRRRYVLYLLRDAGEPVELTTLAEHVAAWENDVEVTEITEQERKRVYVSLYQTHIPRLDEADVVEYNKETGLVSLAGEAREIDSYLQTSEGGLAWEWVYLALAVTGGVLLGLVMADIWVFAEVSEFLVTAGIVTAFVVTAVVHTIYSLQNRGTIPSELRKRL